MKPLSAGSLNLRLRIEAETLTDNGQGGFTKAWGEVITVWGSKRPLRGDEVVSNNIQRSTASARFTIRFRPTVTEKHRLVERDGTIWNIRNAVDPDGRRERTELLCESGVPT